MEIKTLYRYERENGGITISPVKPDVEYTEMYRLIADEGKILVNGNVQTACVDVESTEGWTEIDAPVEDPEIATAEDYENALAEFGVEVES